MTVPRPLVLVLAALPWVAAAWFAFAFLLLRYPTSGVATFSFSSDGSSPWLTAFLPGQRVTPPGAQPDGWTGQRILGSPVYASLRVPGSYDTADVAFQFKPTRQPLIELGIERDPVTQSFEMHPLWSEALSQGWHRAKIGPVQGYVRDGLADVALLSDNPEKLMVWYATSTPFIASDPASATTHVDVNLRGSHDFYAVPAGGAVSFTFKVQDVNRSRTGNAVTFRATRGDELLLTDALGTGGSGETRMGEAGTKTIRLTDLGPGVIEVSLLADDDIFIRSITTNARHWVVGPRLYLADAVGWRPTTPPTTVWTNSRHLVADTFHPEGRQTLAFGKTPVAVKDTHVDYAAERDASERSGTVKLTAPKSDVRIIGDGFFSFSPEAFFIPKPRRLTDAADPAAEGVDAVLTPYAGATLLPDGWVSATASFDLVGAISRPRLTLSSPGILSREGTVDLRASVVRFLRPPLTWSEWWNVLRRDLALAWHRL